MPAHQRAIADSRMHDVSWIRIIAIAIVAACLAFGTFLVTAWLSFNAEKTDSALLGDVAQAAAAVRCAYYVNGRATCAPKMTKPTSKTPALHQDRIVESRGCTDLSARGCMWVSYHAGL
jgi:hypothetical protein